MVRWVGWVRSVSREQTENRHYIAHNNFTTPKNAATPLQSSQTQGPRGTVSPYSRSVPVRTNTRISTPSSNRVVWAPDGFPPGHRKTPSGGVVLRVLRRYVVDRPDGAAAVAQWCFEGRCTVLDWVSTEDLGSRPRRIVHTVLIQAQTAPPVRGPETHSSTRVSDRAIDEGNESVLGWGEARVGRRMQYVASVVNRMHGSTIHEHLAVETAPSLASTHRPNQTHRRSGDGRGLGNEWGVKCVVEAKCVVVAQMVRRKEEDTDEERIERVAVRRNDTVHRERCTLSDTVNQNWSNTVGGVCLRRYYPYEW